jgi:hypothetical protein
MQPSIKKQEAIALRRKGCSYNMINAKLNLPKSTLSDWLSEIPFNPNREMIKRMKKAKLKSAMFKNQQKIEQINQMRIVAIKELGNINKRDRWLLGIGLYLGEGCKNNETIRIVNSDPDIIKIATKWFIEICGLKIKNFRPYIHMYPDNNPKKSLSYWSQITGVPKHQFGKINIDRRTNKSMKKSGRLPYGTLHLHVKSLGNKEHGRKLHRRIAGWIHSIVDKASRE